MTNTTPQPTRFSTIQRLLAILVAIVIVLLASVLSNKVSAPQADAALSPHFCIGASSDEGKFVGKHGPAHCGEASAPVEPEPEPEPPFTLEGSRSGVVYNLKSELRGDFVRLAFPGEPYTANPGNTTYMLLSVRTTSDSAAGRVVLESTTPNSADASRLRYGMRIANSSVCSPSSYVMGASIVPDNSTLSTNSQTAFDIPANGSKAITVCVALNRPVNDTAGAINVPVSFDIRSAN